MISNGSNGRYSAAGKEEEVLQVKDKTRSTIKTRSTTTHLDDIAITARIDGLLLITAYIIVYLFNSRKTHETIDKIR